MFTIEAARSDMAKFTVVIAVIRLTFVRLFWVAHVSHFDMYW